MKYMGSKNRICRDLLPMIQQKIDEFNIDTYIEPMCGGCNIIDKVVCDTKIASDNQKYLIALFQNIQNISCLPESVGKDHYSAVRKCYNEGSAEYDDWYIGAIGFLASYNGRFFDGGYAGIVKTKAGTVRDYYAEAKRNLIEQIPRLQDISFFCRDYRFYSTYENCLFYLDPPYRGTKQYGSSKDFQYDIFWDWCRSMSRKNIVLISEHSAPDDFDCIWSQKVKRTIDNNKHITAMEKLFEIHNGK